jgi:hypothetical protein
VAIAQPVTVTLVQGSEASAAPHPVRVAFDGFAGVCDDTVDTSCLAAFMPTFRVQVGGGAYAPLPVQQLGTERRFQGSIVATVDGEIRTYLFLVDAVQAGRTGGVATVVVRRGLEL